MTNDSQFTTTKSLKGLAYDKYHQGFNILYNKSNTYALVISKIISDKTIGQEKSSFFIFNIKEKKIIFEDDVIDSEIFWEKDFVVRTGRLPGIIKKDKENPNIVGGYTFNVLTLKKKFN